ncbi:MAG: hypothetical protein AMJ59_25145 [Gammaproteobacteria bacterium SG8_31]|nr:MAG: hypothetical protein AMJ59_25145 [Gammaproteobacteria bacterium SG8_31]
MKLSRYITAITAVVAVLVFSAAGAVRPGSDEPPTVEHVQAVYSFVINPPAANSNVETVMIPDGKVLILDRILLSGGSRGDARVVFVLELKENVTNVRPAGTANNLDFRIPITYSFVEPTWGWLQHNGSMILELGLHLRGEFRFHCTQVGARTDVAGCEATLIGRIIDE